MKFVKLRCFGVPDHKKTNGIVEGWHLIIDNERDLSKYLNNEAHANAEAFLGIERKDEDPVPFKYSHGDSARADGIAAILNVKAFSTPEGEKFYPILEVGAITDKKAAGMHRYILTQGPIQINESGGYCGYDTYLKTWNCEVLQVIEKDDVGFPVELDALNCEVLILENNLRVPSFLQQKVKELTGEDGETITLLKERDQQWVLKSIINAKTIAFHSQLQDERQLDTFMGIFAQLPAKRILIDCYPADRLKITEHKLFEVNKAKHKIEFIRTY